MAQEPDRDRVDDVALAILSLTLHDENRVWKNISWDVTDRLYEKGLISNPRRKAKSVHLTPEAVERAERVFRELFVEGKVPNPDQTPTRGAS